MKLNQGKAIYAIKSKSEQNLPNEFELSELPAPSDHLGWYKGEAYTPQYLDSAAQLLYTSGTEGTSKGVVISHKALANTTERLIKVMKMTSEIREYIGVPVNFSFGFGRCRAVSCVGGEFFLPSNGFNPIEISEMLEKDEINAISAVPSLWRLVLETPELFAETGKKVRWIEIGSQYMSANEKRQMKSIFPNAIIVQHYGLTQASRSTFLEIHKEETHLESVGWAIRR